jgi:hypothetical protein
LRRQPTFLQRRMKICTKVPTPRYAEEEWNFGGNDQKIKKMGKGAEFDRNQICDTVTYKSVQYCSGKYSTWVRNSKKNTCGNPVVYPPLFVGPTYTVQW